MVLPLNVILMAIWIYVKKERNLKRVNCYYVVIKCELGIGSGPHVCETQ